ncbi:PAS domain-containing protein [Jiella endophytica]|uniref:histidine kinase n=1 Tax=Jiella endophytica TaxID=2558362 RepID=A0A4Y8R909_9HYPH|nr:ATP-binding protein [Jiella endophytica]TFF18039.1 PAS domain-containing protein [Jiella endophytica]
MRFANQARDDEREGDCIACFAGGRGNEPDRSVAKRCPEASPAPGRPAPGGQWRGLAEIMQVALDGGDPSLLVDRAAELLANVSAADGVAIFELSGDRRTLRLVSGAGEVARDADARAFPAAVCRPLYESLSGEGAVFFDGPMLATALAAELSGRHGLAFPIGPRLQRAGVIALLRREGFDGRDETLTDFVGSLAYVVASAWERRRTDAILALRNQALEALDQGVMITSARRTGEPLIYVNPAFEELTGYSSAEALGRNPRFLQGPETDRSTVQELGEACRDGRSIQTTILNYRRDGSEFQSDLSISPIRDGEGRITHHVGVISDATERLDLEAQFRQAQKMEAIGHLTGGIAHDFNNILAVILGNAEILLEEDLDVAHRPLLDLVIKGAERGALLTQRLLAFGRRQALRPEPVAISQSITSLADMLNRTLGEQIDVAIADRAGSRQAMVDRAIFESALINLAVNARDAMPEGGTLSIATQSFAAGDPALPAELSAGDYIEVRVADTGTGMSPEVLAKAFEPFFTTKAVGRGSGLGLAMVYGFVKQSGGHVAIESALGAGTVVSLFLPVAAEAAKEAAAPARRRSLPTGSESILLVEDEEDVRNFVARLLGKLGYRVTEAEDAASALRVLEAPAKIDLLFSDLILPGGTNGLRLVEQARAMRPGIRVLLTTGYTEEFEKLAKGTPEWILRKPYRQSELATMLRTVLGDGDAASAPGEVASRSSGDNPAVREGAMP